MTDSPAEPHWWCQRIVASSSPWTAAQPSTVRFQRPLLFTIVTATRLTVRASIKGGIYSQQVTQANLPEWPFARLPLPPWFIQHLSLAFIT